MAEPRPQRTPDQTPDQTPDRTPEGTPDPLGADLPEATPGYKPPVPKTLQELHELDQDDESLTKYKKSLLGDARGSHDEGGLNVVVTRLTLLCDTAPKPMTLDLQGDLQAVKKQVFELKEGVDYKIKISFKVQREIVSGLKYHQVMSRKGITVDRASFMVGSYGPRPSQEQEYVTALDEAPRGLMARGTYNIKSSFVDDDQNVYLSWDWSLTIKKDWSG
ncbi:rho GDP-dissociation inhibitor 1 isoform X2 [Gadus macrocephalus]|nr:rho GDP-dissociation inhibitor 1 isoform X2 [Gadus macrocephalus]